MSADQGGFIRESESRREEPCHHLHRLQHRNLLFLEADLRRWDLYHHPEPIQPVYTHLFNSGQKIHRQADRGEWLQQELQNCPHLSNLVVNPRFDPRRNRWPLEGVWLHPLIIVFTFCNLPIRISSVMWGYLQSCVRHLRSFVRPMDGGLPGRTRRIRSRGEKKA